MLLTLAQWSCGRRVGVVQAKRQIHRARLGRPHRRWCLVAQGLLPPPLVVLGLKQAALPTPVVFAFPSSTTLFGGIWKYSQALTALLVMKASSFSRQITIPGRRTSGG